MTENAIAARNWNFNAGPSTLPLPVLEQVSKDLVALPGIGVSILELGHRTSFFKEITAQACQRVRDIFSLDDSFEVFFLQGGGRLMFSLLPMNFSHSNDSVPGYLVTGSWGQKAYQEAVQTSRFYSQSSNDFSAVWTDQTNQFRTCPDPADWNCPKDLSYLHYTTNETIQGVQLKRSLRNEIPETIPIVADMSSDIMSRDCKAGEFDLIYACVQKNLGPAGATLVIAKKELLKRCPEGLPGYCNLGNHAKHQSMYNTPPVFSIYVTNLVLKWFQEEFGSLAEIERFSKEKADLVYRVMDQFPNLYLGHAYTAYRSDMNVTFRFEDEGKEVAFLKGAEEEGLVAIKGHRSVGGIRASLYNAMPMEGARRLADFMNRFALNHSK